MDIEANVPRKRRRTQSRAILVRKWPMGRQIQRAPSPDFQDVVLKYGEGISISTTTGSIFNYKFRLNGMYDPDVAAGGHQPKGFDQYAAFYKRFVVFASKIEVFFADKSSTPGPVVANANLAAVDSNEATTYTTQTMHIQREGANVKSTVATTHTGGNLYGKRGNHLSMYKKVAPLFGVPGQTMLVDDTYQGTDGADPSKQFYWIITYQDFFGNESVANTGATVTITYYARFFDRKVLPSS